VQVCVELEEEKSKHARDMEQGDNVTYMLEKDRERLKQEVGWTICIKIHANCNSHALCVVHMWYSSFIDIRSTTTTIVAFNFSLTGPFVPQLLQVNLGPSEVLELLLLEQSWLVELGCPFCCPTDSILSLVQ